MPRNLLKAVFIENLNFINDTQSLFASENHRAILS